MTIRNEGVAECSKSGFTALLAQGCDLGHQGFAPTPCGHSGRNPDTKHRRSRSFGTVRCPPFGEGWNGLRHGGLSPLYDYSRPQVSAPVAEVVPASFLALKCHLGEAGTTGSDRRV